MTRIKGFTLVELMIVMVIIGIIAAVAIPKLIDLRNRSQVAATQSLAVALATASATNFARRTASSAQGSAITNCQQIATLLSTGALPTSPTFSITSLAIANGAQANCTLNGPGTPSTQIFRGLGIS